MKVAVVGAGTWGTAFSRLLVDRGHEVTLVAATPTRRRRSARPGTTRGTSRRSTFRALSQGQSPRHVSKRQS